MKAGLDRSIARAGLYIDSRGVYETTRRGEGRRGERGGEADDGAAQRGDWTEPTESPTTRNSFFFFSSFFSLFEKDEITGQLAILLKICQVLRDLR